MCKSKQSQLCLRHQPCFTIQILIRFPKYSPLVALPISPAPKHMPLVEPMLHASTEGQSFDTGCREPKHCSLKCTSVSSYIICVTNDTCEKTHRIESVY